MTSLESNPLALGNDWIDDDGISVRVYMFNNEDDYKKQWAQNRSLALTDNFHKN